MKQIYLDYAATTPIDPRVLQVMLPCLTAEGTFGNPASETHAFGSAAKTVVEQARQQVAAYINADAREIVWTSGATEADNLALKGAAEFYQQRGKHIITVKTEHKAVLDSCHALEKKGFHVTYLNPQSNGVVLLADIAAAITAETILLSVMLVNNETGFIQDIAAIGALAKKHNILFHVDAAQAVGKVAIDVKAQQVDLMSLSAHKAYGPKGIGALYVRQKPPVKLAAQIHGGGHERGMRSGTLATHQIAGMGCAFGLAKDELTADNAHAHLLREQLVVGLKALPDIYFNTDLAASVPQILNISFGGVDGDALLTAIDSLAVSNGAACNSVSIEPSHVLQAMGVSNELANSAIRFSLGRFTTAEEIEQAISIVTAAVQRLRRIAPSMRANDAL
ncbi:MAG: IscS subfamily cysteine desulfurase [Gammaproteobacteria bacterium]|nr:IscS subfamily cysteine desulfurase [Gammaproteobacteria bacterium]